jgi:hypothetical protein
MDAVEEQHAGFWTETQGQLVSRTKGSIDACLLTRSVWRENRASVKRERAERTQQTDEEDNAAKISSSKESPGTIQRPVVGSHLDTDTHAWHKRMQPAEDGVGHGLARERKREGRLQQALMTFVIRVAFALVIGCLLPPSISTRRRAPRWYCCPSQKIRVLVTAGCCVSTALAPDLVACLGRCCQG